MISSWQNVSKCRTLPLTEVATDAFLADGFVLEKNDSDSLYLDDIIFRDLNSRDKQEELWLNQYYG